MPPKQTPMMEQYFRLKRENPGCILFFRLGDFYEMFYEDAVLVSRLLNLTLTTRDRNKPKEEQTPMCGVPYHAVDAHLAKLTAMGYKVGICEQSEETPAGGLKSRELTRVVTPGTHMEAVEEGKVCYIAALCLMGEECAGVFCDLTTGTFIALSFRGGDGVDKLLAEVSRLCPAEVLLSPAAAREERITALLSSISCYSETKEEGDFEPAAGLTRMKEQFRSGLEGLPTGETALPAAAGVLLAYLRETQRTDLSHISHFQYRLPGEHMELDLTARRNLELTETLRAKEKKGSLLWSIDRTQTPMGGRLLRSWLEQPLLSPDAIGQRQDAIAQLAERSVERQELAAALRQVGDLERLVGRTVFGSGSARELLALSHGLSRLPRAKQWLEGVTAPLLLRLKEELDDLPRLRELLDAALKEELPATVREGDMIRPGFDPKVDELRNIRDNGGAIVLEMEERERERTGIRNLRIRFNNVFGYFIEISKSYLDKVPEDYIRKQTTANAERYFTAELKELETTILSASDQLKQLEYQIFSRLREETADKVLEIQKTAAAVAQLDVLTGLAAVASEGGFCRPRVDLSDVIEIKEGRHPVVEKMLTGSLFVPNDTLLDGGDNRLAIITGPNMAGKSTYMRQVALITILAQMGSFVPAKSAHIGIVDRVFTRIGASDDLAAGQSTFMVEMSEVAELLQRATPRSLLILDEIGRGTSTYDGMAVARAVVEHCAHGEQLGARTLFATHYHELTELEGQIPGVKNYNIAAKKKDGGILFLRKIVPGGADESYGVEVAKLAGVPESVIQRAREILAQLEAQGMVRPRTEVMPSAGESNSARCRGAELLESLRRTAVETLTPLEALNLLYQWKRELETEET